MVAFHAVDPGSIPGRRMHFMQACERDIMKTMFSKRMEEMVRMVEFQSLIQMWLLF